MATSAPAVPPARSRAARLAALGSRRPMAPAVAEKGGAAGLERLELSHDAVTAAVDAAAAGAEAGH